MADLTILPARPEDAAQLAQIYLEGRRALLPEAAAHSLTPEDFARDSAGEIVLVARAVGGENACGENACAGNACGEVLGFISLWAADHFIHMLYLRPKAQGRGIGARLLQALPDWPHLPYRLKSLTTNQRARGFYLAQGFRVLGHGLSEDGAYEELGIGPAA